MSQPCQQCGRPATYQRPIQQGRRVSSGHLKRRARADHDLCGRCWKKLLTSEERKADNAASARWT